MFPRYSFIDEATIIERCTDSEPTKDGNGFAPSEICQQAATWRDIIEPCEPDPVTLDDIPCDYALRLRQITDSGNTILACRDVRVMKEIMERSRIEGKEFKDPVTQVPLDRHITDVINAHPFSQAFDVDALERKLGGLGYVDENKVFVGDAQRDLMLEDLNFFFKRLMPTFTEVFLIGWAKSGFDRKYAIYFCLIIFIIYAVLYLAIRIKYTS